MATRLLEKTIEDNGLQTTVQSETHSLTMRLFPWGRNWRTETTLTDRDPETSRLIVGVSLTFPSRGRAVADFTRRRNGLVEKWFPELDAKDLAALR